MRIAAPLVALALLAGCGGSTETETANTAAEVHDERAERLREAAEQSTPEAANQLEAMAQAHEQAADRAGEAPAGNMAANGAMPDALSQPAPPKK